MEFRLSIPGNGVGLKDELLALLNLKEQGLLQAKRGFCRLQKGNRKKRKERINQIRGLREGKDPLTGERGDLEGELVRLASLGRGGNGECDLEHVGRGGARGEIERHFCQSESERSEN